MKTNISKLISLSILIVVFSCSEDDDQSVQEPDSPIESIVYVAGLGFENSNFTAELWTDGLQTVLSNDNFNAEAIDMFIDGDDTYIAGYQTNNNDISVATIWKNGVPSTITDGTRASSISTVFVLNNIIYAVGFEANQNGINVAKLWENGVSSSLSDAVNEASATGLHVQDSDIYVVGRAYNGLDFDAVLWKNNVRIDLASSSATETAEDIFVSGSNVYITIEQDREKLFLWENGTTTLISDETISDGINPSSNDLFVSGSDLYGWSRLYN
ncbi:MAG: hypothetical protein WA775_07665 [Psychroserpens sp.]|uniref:hypothetical protein n=1 Tax=Psychroserpens sp. TaxID=2020870 RepID=UPI003C74CD99